jgi:hypothetical protein
MLDGGGYIAEVTRDHMPTFRHKLLWHECKPSSKQDTANYEITVHGIEGELIHVYFHGLWIGGAFLGSIRHLKTPCQEKHLPGVGNERCFGNRIAMITMMTEFLIGIFGDLMLAMYGAFQIGPFLSYKITPNTSSKGSKQARNWKEPEKMNPSKCGFTFLRGTGDSVHAREA